MLPANFIEIEQLSPEWLEMRKGMVTASMVRNVVAKMKRQKEGDPVKYQQCREDYMIDIVTTRLTGNMSDRYVSKAMQDGIEREPLAIAAYENRLNYIVEPMGFVFHPTIEWYGCSPDGLVGSDICIEAKCPTQATHLRYILEYRDAKAKGLDYAPEEHLPQIKALIGCTERPICHFVSYHPEFPDKLKLLVSPWKRDKGMIDQQETEVEKFLAEAETLEKSLRETVLA